MVQGPDALSPSLPTKMAIHTETEDPLAPTLSSPKRMYKDKPFDEVLEAQQRMIHPQREVELLCSYVPTCVLQRALKRGDVPADVEAETRTCALVLVDISGFSALADLISKKSEQIHSSSSTELQQVADLVDSKEGQSLMKFASFRKMAFNRSLSITTAQILQKEDTNATAMKSAQELRDTLNEYFDSMVLAISQSGADIVRIAGDCVICTFDDAHLPSAVAKAFCAATTWVKDLTKEVHGHALSLHIAIASGQLTGFYVGGMLGKWDYILAGEPFLDISSALSEARTGSVVATKDTWQLFEDSFMHDPHSPYRCIVPQRLSTGNVEITVSDESLLRSTLQPDSVRSSVLEQCHRSWSWLASRISGQIPALILDQMFQESSGWLCLILRLSVLFIRFNGLMDNATAKDLNLVQSVFHLLQQQVFANEGSIKEFTVDDKGCVAVAAFGLPPLHCADAPIRACRTALHVIQVIRASFPSISCSAGITTSLVFCASIGNASRREWAILGDSVNTAARFMAAGQNQILVDPATQEACVSAITFRELDPMKVKNKTDLQRVFAALHTNRGPSFQSLDRFSQMVGREDVKETVTKSLQVFKKLKHTGMLRIEGDAGVGKSRMVSFLCREAHRLHSASSLHTACESQLQNRPFYVIRRTILELFGCTLDGMGEVPTPELFTIKETVRNIVPEHLKSQLHVLNPVLNLDFPVPTNPSPDTPSHARSLLLAYILSAKTKSPKHILVLEDAQFMDVESWTLAGQLAELSFLVDLEELPNLSLLICAVIRTINGQFPGRSGVSFTPSDVLEVVTNNFIVTLNPLNYEQTQKMVQSFQYDPNRQAMTSPTNVVATRIDSMLEVAGSVSQKVDSTEELAALVYLRSQGNCSFVTAILESLEKGGLLDHGVNGGVCLRADDNDKFRRKLLLPLPFDLSAVILTDLSARNAFLQMTLKIAVLLGRMVSLHLLTIIHPLANGNVAMILESLLGCVQLGILAAEPSIRGYTDDDKIFVFRKLHHLEMIHQYIAPSLARSIHCQAAIELESYLPETLSSTVELPTVIDDIKHQHRVTLDLINHWMLADNTARAIELISGYPDNVYIRSIEMEFKNVCYCVCKLHQESTSDEQVHTFASTIMQHMNWQTGSQVNPRVMTMAFVVMPWLAGIQLARSSYKGSLATFTAAANFKRRSLTEDKRILPPSPLTPSTPNIIVPKSPLRTGSPSRNGHGSGQKAKITMPVKSPRTLEPYGHNVKDTVLTPSSLEVARINQQAMERTKNRSIQSKPKPVKPVKPAKPAKPLETPSVAARSADRKAVHQRSVLGSHHESTRSVSPIRSFQSDSLFEPSSIFGDTRKSTLPHLAVRPLYQPPEHFSARAKRAQQYWSQFYVPGLSVPSPQRPLTSAAVGAAAGGVGGVGAVGAVGGVGLGVNDEVESNAIPVSSGISTDQMAHLLSSLGETLRGETGLPSVLRKNSTTVQDVYPERKLTAWHPMTSANRLIHHIELERIRENQESSRSRAYSTMSRPSHALTDRSHLQSSDRSRSVQRRIRTAEIRSGGRAASVDVVPMNKLIGRLSANQMPEDISNVSEVKEVRDELGTIDSTFESMFESIHVDDTLKPKSRKGKKKKKSKTKLEIGVMHTESAIKKSISTQRKTAKHSPLQRRYRFKPSMLGGDNVGRIYGAIPKTLREFAEVEHDLTRAHQISLRKSVYSSS